MASENVKLKKGLQIGDVIHTEAEIRESTAGDFIEATEESERPCLTPEGYLLLASSTLVGANMLRRQVVKIGEYPGPLTLGELKKLSGPDLKLLQAAAERLDGTAATEVTDRGRGSAA